MTGHALAARAAAALVAVVAGAASWEHIASVAMSAGERPWVAYSLPLAIDGLIVVGVAALLEDRRSGRVPRMIARVAVAVGVVMTLAANIASAEPTWSARAVAVTAPVAFLLSVEVLTRTGRLREQPKVTAEQQRPASDPAPSAARPRVRRGEAARRAAEVIRANPGAPVAALARMAGVSRATVRRVAANGHVRALPGTGVPHQVATNGHAAAVAGRRDQTPGG